MSSEKGRFDKSSSREEQKTNLKDWFSLEITSEKRRPDELLTDFQAHAKHGALASFFGLVRNHDQGRPVIGLAYDLFEPLAQQSFQKIAEEARDQWGQEIQVSITQTYGYLKVGEMSIGILVSTPHRQEAFAICHYLIEQTKHRVPIWKKEYYEDGESEWLQGHALCEPHYP